MKNGKLRDRIRDEFRTQADFSMEVLEDETMVSRIVNGRRSLRIERQKVWADVLGCLVADIFPAGQGVNHGR